MARPLRVQYPDAWRHVMNLGGLLVVYFTHNIAAGAHDMALC